MPLERPGARPDRVTRAFGQLPEIKAPDTLLPRVMAAARAWAARPWYERAWFTWPAGWQAATVAGLLLFVAGLWQWLPEVDPGRRFESRIVSNIAGNGVSRLEAFRLAAHVLTGSLQPILLYASGIVVIMAGACLIGAVAISRAVFGRT